MLPEIEIRLFGAPSLTLNGRPLTGFISNKVPALVYYVAATGRPQMRDLIATLLWTPKGICGRSYPICGICLVLL